MKRTIYNASYLYQPHDCPMIMLRPQEFQHATKACKTHRRQLTKCRTIGAQHKGGEWLFVVYHYHVIYHYQSSSSYYYINWLYHTSAWTVSLCTCIVYTIEKWRRWRTALRYTFVLAEMVNAYLAGLFWWSSMLYCWTTGWYFVHEVGCHRGLSSDYIPCDWIKYCTLIYPHKWQHYIKAWSWYIQWYATDWTIYIMFSTDVQVSFCDLTKESPVCVLYVNIISGLSDWRKA